VWSANKSVGHNPQKMEKSLNREELKKTPRTVFERKKELSGRDEEEELSNFV
jgi:hypothetical protein